MSKENLHIGLIGCGNWGRHILRDLLSLECKVTVLARSDSSKERAAKANKIVGSLSEIYEVDGFVVATPLATHFEVISEILKNFPGVPIYSEKALTNNVKHAKELLKRAPEHLFVMDKWRYQKGVLALKQIAESRELGEVVGLETVRLAKRNHHPDVDMVWTLLPHDLTIALEIFGKIQEVRWAVGDRNGKGLFGVNAAFGKGPWHHARVSSRAKSQDREIKLLCENGFAIVSPAEKHDALYVFHGDDPLSIEESACEVREIENTMPLLAELEAFTNYLRGNGPPPKSNAEEACQVVKTVCKVRELVGLSES